MKEAVLRFFGPKISEEGEVPLEILVRTLNGFQQTAYLLAASLDGIEIKQRFKPSEGIKRASSLVCRIPTPGSYCIPISLSSTGDFAPDSITPLDKAHQVFEHLASKTVEDFKILIPDSRFREKIIQTVSSFLPKIGDQWELEYLQNGKSPVALNQGTRTRLKDWDVSSVVDEMEDTVMTVTGELVKIDFSGNSVTIKHPVSQRAIECVYFPEIEDTLIDSRRELIQVTGQFILDDQGLPTKLNDVTKIAPVDLDCLNFSEVVLGGKSFTISPPLQIQPALDETKQYLVAEVEDLDMQVFGITREILADEIREHLEMLWIEYANEDDENLNESAKQLKKSIVERLRPLS